MKLAIVMGSIGGVGCDDQDVTAKPVWPELVSICINWIEGTFHQMVKDSLGFVDAVGAKIAHIGAKCLHLLQVSAYISVTRRKRRKGRIA